MYEENLRPLPPGDFVQIFAADLAAIERDCQLLPHDRVTPASVVQWASQSIQPRFAAICRRLLLPGSRLRGYENLQELMNLARDGKSCILCLNHLSTLDVPTLYVLLEDQANLDVFHRMIWIAGRKLQEDVGRTHMLLAAFNRVIVSPRTWLRDGHSEQELQEAHEVNLAAHRAIHELRHQGWIFSLFPTGTRARPQEKATLEAMPETDSYLKHFDFLVMGRIDGCTLPVSRDRDLTHETPTLDRVCYTFGPVLRTDEWRHQAARRYATLDPKVASARAIMEDIAAIDPQ